MQFLAISQRRTESFTASEFEEQVKAEVRQARALYAEGFIRQIWHRKDLAGACILVEARSEKQVQEKLDTLPLFQNGMLAVSIIPLKPYAGFACACRKSAEEGEA